MAKTARSRTSNTTLASEMRQRGQIKQIVWLPPDLTPIGKQRQEFVADLRNSSTDYLQTSLADLQTRIRSKLEPVSSVIWDNEDDANLVNLCLFYHEDDEGQIAEKLFKALTEKGEDNREIRRPVVLRELCAVAGPSEKDVTTVIEIFRGPGRSFLMPPVEIELTDDTLIDISHESLIRIWKRLQQWVDEEAESRTGRV
jgi:hypothetical protein